jgi:hypothetical protein
MKITKLTDFTKEQLSLYGELMMYCKLELKTVTDSEREDIDLLITQIANAKIQVEAQERIIQN